MTFLSSLQDPNFERDIGEAQKQIDDLAASAEESGLDVSAEISELRAKLENLKEWKHKLWQLFTKHFIITMKLFLY